jgi:hypothetical protein
LSRWSPVRGPLIHRGVLGPSLGLFTGVAATAGFLAFVAIYGRDDLAMGGSGPVLLVFGLVVVGCRIVFARLPDRDPPYLLAAVALALIAAGMVCSGDPDDPSPGWLPARRSWASASPL